MNKVHLAEELSNRVAGITRAQAEKMLEELTKVITEKLIAGDEVTLAGFGAFSARKRKGRIGVNPRDVSQQIEIPAVTVAKFKAGKNLKDALKRGGEAPKEETPAEPVEEAPAEETPAEEPVSEPAPAEETPAEPVEEAPAEETPVEPETPAEPEAPAEEEDKPQGTPSF